LSVMAVKHSERTRAGHTRVTVSGRATAILPATRTRSNDQMSPRSLALVLTLAVATPLAAQSDTATRIPRHLCWRGKPFPECTSFWITEFGVDAVLWSTQTTVRENFGGGDVYRYTARDFDSRFVWTVGPMFNTGPHTALGGTLSISPFGEGYRAAIEARRRWWTSSGLALDLSAGALRMDVQSRTDFSSRDEFGLTAGAFIVGGDLINVNGRADLLVTGGKPRLGTSLGLGGGSYVALVGSVLLGLLIVAYISAGPID
jgi:hypothetical protein